MRLRGDGTSVNRDAIGARVTVIVSEKRWMREVKSSRGTYSSADARALLFGLGEHGCEGGVTRAALEVRWPNGETKRFEAGTFALNQYVTIDYAAGSSRPSRVAQRSPRTSSASFADANSEFDVEGLDVVEHGSRYFCLSAGDESVLRSQTLR